MTTAAIIAGAVLIVMNGAFVASEFGLIGAKRAAVNTAAAAGKRSAIAAQRMQNDVLTTLGGAQLGITLCSLAVGRLTEPALASVIESSLGGLIEMSESTLHALGFATGLSIVVVIHMIFGEMVPKNLALVGPERTLYILAVPMAAYMTIARPVVRSLLSVSNLVLKMCKIKPITEITDTATPAELSLMARDSKEQGHLDDHDVVLLDSALIFGTTEVKDIMIPASQAVTVSMSDTVKQACDKFSRTRYSRLAVTGDGTDDIIGMIHSIDMPCRTLHMT